MESSPSPAPAGSVVFDEVQWMHRMRQTISHRGADIDLAAAVFDVPKIIRAVKPEAYTPQYFALGPYHQHRPELRNFERYKLAAAKKFDKFDDLVQLFLQFNPNIRSPYHRIIEFGEQTMAWMMAIDACFLLDFLQHYHPDEEVKSLVVAAAATGWGNRIIRDALMLENQIPLFLLRKSLELKYASLETADTMLSAIFDRFLKLISPIRIPDAVSLPDFNSHAHILELFYYLLVTKSGDDADELEILLASNDDPEMDFRGSEDVKEAFDTISKLDLTPVRFIKENLYDKPLRFSSGIFETVKNKFPQLSTLGPLAGWFIAQPGVQSTMHDVSLKEFINSPVIEAIMLPNVSQLSRSGVKFRHTTDGINGIHFELATATLTLPVVTLDSNADVLLRNLIAYEASVVKGPLVLARYTELMNGLIDTPKDVRILRENEIIVNRMKSDKEVADLWNSMSRQIRLSRVPKLDQVIKDLNTHYDKKFAVRANRMLRKYVFKSWKYLTFLAALVLLVMTGLQTFCSVYTCNSWLKSLQTQSTGHN